MRDLNRRMVAAAKSRRATPEELREASKRLKEIEQDLLTQDLKAETRNGEERLRRYQRTVRLRSMREEFQATRPTRKQGQVNSLVLAIVMTVGSFLVCAFCAGGVYAGVQIANQKPDPLTTSSNFWEGMENKDYQNLHETFFYPTLRARIDEQRFADLATQADADYGIVTNVALTGEAVDQNQNTATLTYKVTRGSRSVYSVTLKLILYAGAWKLTDIGAAVDPQSAGLPAVATATPSGAATTPTATPAKK